jgi:hypothetical protein
LEDAETARTSLDGNFSFVSPLPKRWGRDSELARGF